MPEPDADTGPNNEADAMVVMNSAYVDFSFVNAPHQGSEESPAIPHLLETIDAHAQTEAAALATYRKLRDAGDPVMALILTLVLEDEERHHALLQRISTSLYDSLQWTHAPEDLPTGTEPVPPVTPELLATLHDLLREETEGVDRLKKEAHQLRGLHGGVDAALMEVMALDSQKHAHLLEFLVHRAQQRAKDQDENQQQQRPAPPEHT